jgi:hypothetical protein
VCCPCPCLLPLPLSGPLGVCVCVFVLCLSSLPLSLSVPLGPSLFRTLFTLIRIVCKLLATMPTFAMSSSYPMNLSRADTGCSSEEHSLSHRSFTSCWRSFCSPCCSIFTITSAAIVGNGVGCRSHTRACSCICIRHAQGAQPKVNTGTITVSDFVCVF